MESEEKMSDPEETLTDAHASQNTIEEGLTSKGCEEDSETDNIDDGCNTENSKSFEKLEVNSVAETDELVSVDLDSPNESNVNGSSGISDDVSGETIQHNSSPIDDSLNSSVQDIHELSDTNELDLESEKLQILNQQCLESDGIDSDGISCNQSSEIESSPSSESVSCDNSIQPHLAEVPSVLHDDTHSIADHSTSVIKDQDNSSLDESSTEPDVTDIQQHHHADSGSDPPKAAPCQITPVRPDTNQDINDELLSELDAELEISEAQIENDIVDLPNGMTQRKISVSEVPEYKELKTKYESLQKHLEQQIIDAQRFKSEAEKTTHSLAIAIKERDSYLDKIQLIEKGDDGHILRIKELEFSFAKQNKEMTQMKEKMSSHDAAAKRAVATLQGELKNKTDHLTKQFDDCKKEKETMVMKYAQAEAKNIELQQKMYKNDQKMVANNKEREGALNKFKQMKQEKQKMQEIYENRAMEIASLRREIERQKELVNNTDLKSKWAHNKLKAELEGHKETKTKVEELQTKLRQAREEIDITRRESQVTMKSLQDAEVSKARDLDHRLKETQCELMMHKQEKSDKDELTTVLKTELDSLKTKHKELLDELMLYRDKVQCLDDERLHQEETLTKFKDTLQKQKIENQEMKTRLEQLENVEEDILIERAKVVKAKKRVEEYENSNRELVTDMEACARRESEYLELQQKLSDKNVVLQSENSALSARMTQITEEHQVLTKRCAGSEENIHKLSAELAMVKKARKEETTSLTTELENKSKIAKDLAVKLEEEKGEVKTLKRKHAANTKDLMRQLQHSKRRLEALEKTDKDGTSVGSMGSRTSSNGSLDTLANNSNANRPNQIQERNSSPAQEEYHPIVEVVEIDKNMLMEKIVKLQRIHARKNEKIEFVEDHNRQLLNELKKKTKIIQNYVMREESGTLAPEQMDQNKLSQARNEAQAQLAKKGGIMASLYSQHVQDGHMTLDLSLEITQKLQQVLEDTLLKNITLKENIDTLGREIARLSQENRRLQISMQDLEEKLS